MEVGTRDIVRDYFFLNVYSTCFFFSLLLFFSFCSLSLPGDLVHKAPVIMGGLRDNTYNLDCNSQSYYSTMLSTIWALGRINNAALLL